MEGIECECQPSLHFPLVPYVPSANYFPTCMAALYYISNAKRMLAMTNGTYYEEDDLWYEEPWEMPEEYADLQAKPNQLYKFLARKTVDMKHK